MPIIKNKYTVDDQEITIYMEVDELPSKNGHYYDDMRGSGDRVLEYTHDLFGEGLKLAKNCALQVISTIGKMSDEKRPDEFSIQLAIKADMELGAVLTKIGAEAQMQVMMKWTRKDT